MYLTCLSLFQNFFCAHQCSNPCALIGLNSHGAAVAYDLRGTFSSLRKKKKWRHRFIRSLTLWWVGDEARARVEVASSLFHFSGGSFLEPALSLLSLSDSSDSSSPFSWNSSRHFWRKRDWRTFAFPCITCGTKRIIGDSFTRLSFTWTSGICTTIWPRCCGKGRFWREGNCDYIHSFDF